MSKRAIVALKVVVHLLCLAPVAWLWYFYTSGALALNADPINYITHFTGDWALYILIADLAITPIRRLSLNLSWLIRFRRLIGLYAFFYATLHLSTYIFLFSGYDLPSVLMDIKAGHPGSIVDQWKHIWPTVKGDILKRRFIQVGFFAWLILLALAATSPAFIMRAMGGKKLAAPPPPRLYRRHRRRHPLLVARQSRSPRPLEGHCRSNHPPARPRSLHRHQAPQSACATRQDVISSGIYAYRGLKPISRLKFTAIDCGLLFFRISPDSACSPAQIEGGT